MSFREKLHDQTNGVTLSFTACRQRITNNQIRGIPYQNLTVSEQNLQREEIQANKQQFHILSKLLLSNSVVTGIVVQ